MPSWAPSKRRTACSHIRAAPLWSRSRKISLYPFTCGISYPVQPYDFDIANVQKVRCWFNNRRARATREQQRRIAASRAKAIGEDDGRRLKSAAGEEGCVPNRTARRLSLPANLGNGPLLPLETLDANKPYRHRATDDLRCEGESKKRDSTDVLVDTVSREANLILARVNDQPYGWATC